MMDILQRLMARHFGWDYALICSPTGLYFVHHVVWIQGTPYTTNGERLFANGQTSCSHDWEPATEKITRWQKGLQRLGVVPDATAAPEPQAAQRHAPPPPPIQTHQQTLQQIYDNHIMKIDEPYETLYDKLRRATMARIPGAKHD